MRTETWESSELLAAVSRASRSVGELHGEILASPFAAIVGARLCQAGERFPALEVAARCAVDDIDVLDALPAAAGVARLDAVDASARWAIDAVRNALALHQKHLADAAHPHRGRYETSVLDLLFTEGEVTVKAVVTHLGASATTAGSLLKHLASLGIVEEVTGRRRDRVFVYRSVLECLEPAPEVTTGAPAALVPHTLAELVPIVVSKVFAGSEAQRVVVFGSVARGEDGPDSDIDLLVVLPHVTSSHADAVRIMRLLHDTPVPVDVMVTDPSRLEVQAKIPGVIRVALREGRSYERAA